MVVPSNVEVEMLPATPPVSSSASAPADPSLLKEREKENQNHMQTPSAPVSASSAAVTPTTVSDFMPASVVAAVVPTTDPVASSTAISQDRVETTALASTKNVPTVTNSVSPAKPSPAAPSAKEKRNTPEVTVAVSSPTHHTNGTKAHADPMESNGHTVPPETTSARTPTTSASDTALTATTSVILEDNSMLVDEPPISKSTTEPVESAKTTDSGRVNVDSNGSFLKVQGKKKDASDRKSKSPAPATQRKSLNPVQARLRGKDPKATEGNQEAEQRSTDEKYKKLKRKLKEVLEENERLSAELNRSQRRARNLRKEKNVLLDQLCSFQRRLDNSDSTSSLSSDSDLSDVDVAMYSQSYQSRSRKPSPSTTKRSLASNSQPAAASNTASNKQSRTPVSQKTSEPKAAAATAVAAGEKVQPPQRKKPGPKPKSAQGNKGQGASTGGSQPQAKGKQTSQGYTPSTPSTITTVGSATQKPKRIHNSNKQRPSLSKVRKVQALERDESGNIKLPATVGIITVWNIGHVVYDREAFHNERYIWPVGYKMSRMYNSMIDPATQTTYTCSVIDDGESPKFQIDAEDQPGKPIIAGTATGAWTHVVKMANTIRRRDHSNSASGPDYFGFSNATIAKMIQDLPKVDKCTSYIMQRFEEPSSSASTKSTGAGNIGGGEKRKLSSGTRTKGEGGEEGNEDEDEGRSNNEDEEEYASLGTVGEPQKKKIKTGAESLKIRNAGFAAGQGRAQVEDMEVDENKFVDIEKDDDDDDDDEEEEEDQESNGATVTEKADEEGDAENEMEDAEEEDEEDVDELDEQEYEEGKGEEEDPNDDESDETNDDNNDPRGQSEVAEVLSAGPRDAGHQGPQSPLPQ